MCIICMGIAKLLSLTICSCLSTSSDVSKHCKCLPDYFRTQTQNLAQLSQTRRIRDHRDEEEEECVTNQLLNTQTFSGSLESHRNVWSHITLIRKHRKKTRGSDRENEKESLFIDSAKHMLKNQSTRSAREKEKVGERCYSCGVSGLTDIAVQEVIHCRRLFWFLSEAVSKQG